MCHPAVFWAATAIAAGVTAKAQVEQGKFARDIGEYNARVSENAAEKTLGKARIVESAERQKASELASKQRAIFGASGAQVDSGTPLSVQEDTALIGELNVLRVRESAEDRATALRTEAELARAEGEQAFKQGISKASATTIGAVGSIGGSSFFGSSSTNQVAAKWYDFNSPIVNA